MSKDWGNLESLDSTQPVHTQFEGGSGVQSGMGWNGMRKTPTEHYTLEFASPPP